MGFLPLVPWKTWKVCTPAKDMVKRTRCVHRFLPSQWETILKQTQTKTTEGIGANFGCFIYELSIGQEKKTLTRLKIDVQRTIQWLVIALSREGENEKLFHKRLKLQDTQGLSAGRKFSWHYGSLTNGVFLRREDFMGNKYFLCWLGHGPLCKDFGSHPGWKGPFHPFTTGLEAKAEIPEPESLR